MALPLLTSTERLAILDADADDLWTWALLLPAGAQLDLVMWTLAEREHESQMVVQ